LLNVDNNADDNDEQSELTVVMITGSNDVNISFTDCDEWSWLRLESSRAMFFNKRH